MKVNSQSTLCVGASGTVLIDATNKTSHSSDSSNKKSKKRERPGDENRPPKVMRKDGIFVDVNVKNISKKFVDVAVQTDILLVNETDNKITAEMLTCDEPPEAYYKIVAETRRKALEECLVENESLVEENTILKKENLNLKKDNEYLEEMVNDAKEMARLIEKLPI